MPRHEPPEEGALHRKRYGRLSAPAQLAVLIALTLAAWGVLIGLGAAIVMWMFGMPESP